MEKSQIRIYDLKDSRQCEQGRTYWEGKSQEDRLSAVEELRRQYAMFSVGTGYDGSQRLRRVLRIVQ